MFLARLRSTFSKIVASWFAYSTYMLRSVLKRREDRLKREQAGLRSLISGLVGGPALLREWEREWVSRFGGPERDEATSDISEDDGPDDGESDEDDANLHPKKRTKSVPKKPTKDIKPKKEETNPGVVLEKRKRGRPRNSFPSKPFAIRSPSSSRSQSFSCWRSSSACLSSNSPIPLTLLTSRAPNGSMGPRWAHYASSDPLASTDQF